MGQKINVHRIFFSYLVSKLQNLISLEMGFLRFKDFLIPKKTKNLIA